MWLLDKMLRQLVSKGELTVIDHDGREYHYGVPDPAIASVRVRLTDKGAAFKIVADPRLGAGEAYMDGRMVVETRRHPRPASCSSATTRRSNGQAR